MQKMGNLRWLWLSIVVIIVDQFTKNWINQHYILGIPRPQIPFVNFTLAYNQGAAFSFLSNVGGWQKWLFIGIAIVVSIAIIVWLARLPSKRNWTAIGLSLIFGGAVGNLFDRIYRGYVVDFIDFHVKAWHWPAFNIADSAITIGVFMLLLEVIFVKREANER